MKWYWILTNLELKNSSDTKWRLRQTNGNLLTATMTEFPEQWNDSDTFIYVREGTYVLFSDLVKGMVVQSGNDASCAIAEHIAGSEEGFVYLVYVDKTGDTSLLYPNNQIVEKKKAGKLKFPEDFGGEDIKTTKDCKDCKKEKTTIFVLLSDDPIENIQNMNEEDLKNIQTKQKNKNRSILLNKKERTILVDKLEFFVE